MAAVKKNSLIQRRALVANLFTRHLWLQIEGIGSESSAGVGEASGANFQRAPIVTLVSGGFEIGETVFLEQCRVGGVGDRGIFAGLRRTLNLPPRKLLRKDGRGGRIRARAGGEGNAGATSHD